MAIYFLVLQSKLSQSSDADLLPLVLESRRELVETIADFDDDIADEFLGVDDSLQVRPASLKAALRRLVIGRKALPVMVGSALKNTGVQVRYIVRLKGNRDLVELWVCNLSKCRLTNLSSISVIS